MNGNNKFYKGYVCTVPRLRIYPLSEVESRAMKDYVAEALRQWLISQSTLPDFEGFYFVRKEGGQTLSVYQLPRAKFTVKYLHQLPLMPSAIELGSSIYTKLDLHSAYNLVH